MNADSPFERAVHVFNVVITYFTHWLLIISLLHLPYNLQMAGKDI